MKAGIWTMWLHVCHVLDNLVKIGTGRSEFDDALFSLLYVGVQQRSKTMKTHKIS